MSNCFFIEKDSANHTNDTDKIIKKHYQLKMNRRN